MSKLQTVVGQVRFVRPLSALLKRIKHFKSIKNPSSCPDVSLINCNRRDCLYEDEALLYKTKTREIT